MQRDKALDRIRKLLRLGESDNPHEAAQAIARAQRLMDEHRVEAAMLEGSELDRDEIRGWSDPVDVGTGRRLPRWRWALAWALCRANGCVPLSTWTERGRRKGIRLVGRASNVQTVRYLYRVCLREIERLTDLKGRGNGATWRNNFRLGCVDGIRETIALERRHMEDALRARYAGSTALVRLDGVLAELRRESDAAKRYTVERMGVRWTSGAESSRYDPDARAQGREAGAGLYRRVGWRRRLRA